MSAAAVTHAVAPTAHAAAPPVQRKAEPRSETQEAPQRLLTSLSSVPAVQRKCAACEAEEHEETMPVQPRLEVGPVDDHHEREADNIAGQVMAMREPAPASAAGATVQRAPAEMPDLTQDDEQTPRMRAVPGDGGEHIAASSSQLTSGGFALPEQTRSFYESRMSRDLSDVRVHRDNDSDVLNQSISARAFTFQNHIWLSGSESEGPSFTMAHELAHVLQQTQPGPSGPSPTNAANATTTPATAPAVQRAAPAAAAAVLTIGAVVGKCILGAIGGVLFDAAIQAIWHSIKEWTWRFWEVKWDYCSTILSAILGCIAGPVSAATLEPWLAANLGPKLGNRAGTLTGKLLLFLAAKVGMGIPVFIVKQLAKLGCISPEEAVDLGVRKPSGGGGDTPSNDIPAPEPRGPSRAPSCTKKAGDIEGNERILLQVNTTDFLNRNEEAKLDRFADSIRGTKDDVAIHGLASVDGPAAYNDRLSCSRALAFKRKLIDRRISSSRIVETYRHGEVPGPKDWQRSVVFELLPKGVTPDRPTPNRPDRPEPDTLSPDRPTPDTPAPDRPTPHTPDQPGVAPQFKLRSIQFISDHRKLKNNTANWSGTGKAYGEPEWKAGNGTPVSAPITQTKNTRISAIAELEVTPPPAAPVSFKFLGRGPQPFFNFEGTASAGSSKTVHVPLLGQTTLPDVINSWLSQAIVWVVEVAGQKTLIETSFDHEFFTTYGTPVGDLTYKRIAKAVELTRGFTNNPHSIVSGQMARFPFYNLKNVIKGEPWQLADEIPAAPYNGKGADCQSIVRFVTAVNKTIGLPGKAKGVAVYAKPTAPAVPVTADLIESGGAKGGMFEFDEKKSDGTGIGYALYDAGDNGNNYEAALHFSTAGETVFPAPWRVAKYYPGGVKGGPGLPSTESVLNVFKRMVRYELTRQPDEKGRPKWYMVSGTATTVWCYKNKSVKCDDDP